MGRCESCNRPLRSSRSMELGYGPGCWSRLEPDERDAVLAARSGDAEPDERDAVLAARSGDAEPAAPVGNAATPPPPAPHAPGRSNAPLAVLASWATMLVLAAVLLLAWRWVLAGLGLVAVMAVAGLILEKLDERARTATSPRRRSRTVDAAPPRAGARRVPVGDTHMGSRAAPVR